MAGWLKRKASEGQDWLHPVSTVLIAQVPLTYFSANLSSW